LRQEEWGEIKEFVKNTDAYRNGLKETLENIRKENKERFEILLNQVRTNDVNVQRDYEETNKRISTLKSTAGSIITWGVISLLGVATAWGALTTTVYRNTQKWDAHDKQYGVPHGESN
jgi:hypothetical protein